MSEDKGQRSAAPESEGDELVVSSQETPKDSGRVAWLPGWVFHRFSKGIVVEYRHATGGLVVGYYAQPDSDNIASMALYHLAKDVLDAAIDAARLVQRLRYDVGSRPGGICEEAARRVEQLEAALRDIINPINKMERELPEGAQLNGGMAWALARDPDYLRDIARAALARRV